MIIIILWGYLYCNCRSNIVGVLIICCLTVLWRIMAATKRRYEVTCCVADDAVPASGWLYSDL
jgi:hypothetical protein